MDGRRIRLWLCGSVIVGGSLMGCTRKQTMPGGAELPPALQPAMPKKSFSLFSRSDSPPTPTQPQTMPADSTTSSKSSKGKKDEWSADSIVAFAELRMQVADREELQPGDREKIIDSAREAFQNALKKDPKHKSATIGLANLYSKIGELKQADEMYRRYLAMNPKDHAATHEVAMAHARVKDWNGAVYWCNQALAIDPENRTYRKTLGFSLTHSGKYEEGFETLCKVMPEAQARYSMAKALTHLEQPEMGKQQLILALQADPKFTPARELLAEMQSENAVPTARTVNQPAVIQNVGYEESPQQPTP